SGQERVDHTALLGHVGLTWRDRAAHPPPGPAGELTRRVRAAAGDLTDLAEWHAEHVMQDEGDALGGGEVLENDQHRQADRVREFGLLRRVLLRNGRDDRLEVVVR